MYQSHLALNKSKYSKNFLYIFIVTIFFSCGKISPEGKIESKDIKVEDFVSLNLDGKFRAFYVKSDSSFVNVETYKNIADNLTISVKDKTLDISEKHGVKGIDFYNVTIYSKYNLEQLSLSDSVEMNISSEIKADQFKLNLKNNAKFIGSVNTRKTSLEMTEKSRANLGGKSENAFIKISDTASLIAPFWAIKNLKIEAKNGIYAEVNAKDSLKGNIKNTSNFVYYGDPIRAFKIEKNANVENKNPE